MRLVVQIALAIILAWILIGIYATSFVLIAQHQHVIPSAAIVIVLTGIIGYAIAGRK